MDDRQAERLINEVSGVGSALGWVAVWMFCLFVTQCGAERVKIQGDVSISPAIQAVEKPRQQLGEWLDGLDKKYNWFGKDANNE